MIDDVRPRGRSVRGGHGRARESRFSRRVIRGMLRPMKRFLIPVAAILILAGCQKKINDDNFGKLKTGMTYEQVVAILGKGEKQSDAGVSTSAYGVPGSRANNNTDTTVFVFKEDRREISATFKAGKLIDFNKAGF